MRALVADRHDLFRQSLTLLLEELPEPPAIVDEAGCLMSFFGELHKSRYDLIFLGSNICPHGKFFNCDLFRVRDHQPQTQIILISENPQSSGAHISIDKFPIDEVLDKSCCTNTFKNSIQQLLAVQMSATGTRQKYKTPKSTLFSGAASKLTPRQQDVLKLLAFGKSNKEIAQHLQLSEGTVKVHVTAILRSFSVSNRTQAMLMAQRLMEKSLI